MKKNYYAQLGVSRTATQAQLHSAYREQSRRWHPDRPDGDAERFRDMSEAYRCLIDSEARAKYDTARAEWLAEHAAIDCPSCGQTLRIPMMGVGFRCVFCKTVLTEWTTSGRIKVQGINFLANASQLAGGLATATVDIAADRATELAGELQGRLIEWTRKQLGLKGKRKKKGS